MFYFKFTGLKKLDELEDLLDDESIGNYFKKKSLQESTETKKGETVSATPVAYDYQQDIADSEWVFSDYGSGAGKLPFLKLGQGGLAGFSRIETKINRLTKTSAPEVLDPETSQGNYIT
jgi:hypothetical protein